VPPARRQEPSRVPSRRSLIVLALAGAAAVAGALIAVSVLGSRGSEAAPAPTVAAPTARHELFRGVPQDGIALGKPTAPVTLVEYADLQCPFCAVWAREAFPTIVDEYVRTGRVRVLFRGLAFLGPDSDTALRAALAAGEQDRLWDVVHGLFASQGAENSGWVTDDLLQSFAGTGVDTPRMLAGTRSPFVEQELLSARQEATAAGVRGTPSFQLGPTDGALTLLDVGALDLETFRSEIDRALAG
jgi:protein-disulfide isomerase